MSICYKPGRGCGYGCGFFRDGANSYDNIESIHRIQDGEWFTELAMSPAHVEISGQRQKGDDRATFDSCVEVRKRQLVILLTQHSNYAAKQLSNAVQKALIEPYS
jgi:hypothetical protein